MWRAKLRGMKDLSIEMRVQFIPSKLKTSKCKLPSIIQLLHPNHHTFRIKLSSWVTIHKPLNHNEHKLNLHIAHCYQYYIAMHKEQKLKSQRTLITQGFLSLMLMMVFLFPNFWVLKVWQIFPNFSNYTFF